MRKGTIGSFNPFAEMGINTNDPNYMQNMMNDPAVAENMGNMLRNPAVIDQVVSPSSYLSVLFGPFVRTSLPLCGSRRGWQGPKSIFRVETDVV